MRLAAMLVCVGLLGGFAGAQSANPRPAKKPTKNVGQLKGDLNRLRDEKRRLQAELKKTRRQASEVLADIRVVDGKLEEVVTALMDTRDRLTASREEQREVTVALDNATERLAETKVSVENRLKRIYMQGDASLLTAIVGSRSVGDLASQQMLFERIAAKDRSIFDTYRQLRAQVAVEKHKADELVERIESLVNRQRRQQESLKVAREEKRGKLDELKQRADQIKELIAQFEADERQIAAQIRALTAKPRPDLPAFTGRFARPVNGRVTSGFGMRMHPILRIRRPHNGVDFDADSGDPIRAAAAGVVAAAQYMRGYGNVVILDHGGGVSTVYAHCSRILVATGERITQGQRIALVGATGLATGPHLHFEVWVNGRAVNPMGRY